MKIKEGFTLRNVADMNVVVPVSENALDFKSMLSLNETGACVWQAMKEDISEAQLVQKLVDEYEVEEKTAESDIREFLDEIRALGTLEE